MALFWTVISVLIITHLNQNCFLALKNILKVGKFLSQTDFEKLVHAVISRMFEYYNAVFSGHSKSSVELLQLIKNAATRILKGMKDNDTPLLKALHWLPVQHGITF